MLELCILDQASMLELCILDRLQLHAVCGLGGPGRCSCLQVLTMASGGTGPREALESREGGPGLAKLMQKNIQVPEGPC